MKVIANWGSFPERPYFSSCFSGNPLSSLTPHKGGRSCRLWSLPCSGENSGLFREGLLCLLVEASVGYSGKKPGPVLTWARWNLCTCGGAWQLDQANYRSVAEAGGEASVHCWSNEAVTIWKTSSQLKSVIGDVDDFTWMVIPWW